MQAASKGPFKKKLSVAKIATDSTAVTFFIGATGAARFDVPIKDIACVALSPKREGGQLKIVSVLCRAPQRRDSAPNKKGAKRRGLELICHIWRPKDTASMWDFYIGFERLLQKKVQVYDPYLGLAKQCVSRDATNSTALEFGGSELEELAMARQVGLVLARS
jgi:hypothetical protein